MSSKNVTTDVVSVDEQAFESAGEEAVDEDGFEVVDETPEFEATVEQETQAKVDANPPDGIANTTESSQQANANSPTTRWPSQY